MGFGLIPDKDIPKYKKKLDKFFEDYLDIEREFTIDCESLNVDFYNSESMTTIRYRKPNRESIYVTQIFKESDESAYFFGLARENTVATSSHLNRGDQIHPLLVTTLNTSNKSNSGLVFAQNMDNYQIVLLMRIDCSELDDLEIKVLREKNNIVSFKNKKGFINFGKVGNFYMLKDIRNFISNVTIVNENKPYVKVTKVDIPEEYQSIVNSTKLINKSIYEKLTKSPSLTFGLDTNEEKDEIQEEIEIQEESNELIIENVEDSINNIKNNSLGNKVFEDSLDEDEFGENKISSDEINYKNYYFEDNILYIESSIPKNELFLVLNSIFNISNLVSLELNDIQIIPNINDNIDINIEILFNNEDVEFIETYLNKLNFLIINT